MTENRVTISSPGKGIRVRIPIDSFINYMEAIEMDYDRLMVYGKAPQIRTMEPIAFLLGLYKLQKKKGGYLPQTLDLIKKIAEWGHKNHKPVILQTKGLTFNEKTPGV